MIETFGTANVDEDELGRYIMEHVDLRPAYLIEKFDLRRPIYRQLAAYGHMGREDLGVLWEKTDLADELRAAFNK